MKSKNNSKRNIIQWIAFGIVILTLVLKLVLLGKGIAPNLSSSTIDAMTWAGFAIGIILISYLLLKKTQNKSTHSN